MQRREILEGRVRRKSNGGRESGEESDGGEEWMLACG